MVEVIIVSQCLENQGNTTVRNEIMNNANSYKVRIKLLFLLNNLTMINKKGNKNIIIPVGLVKKIRPKEKPESIENVLLEVLFKYHLVKNNKFRVLKAVRDRSIK